MSGTPESTAAAGGAGGAPTEDLAAALVAARACRLCADTLSHEPRPVLRVNSTARVLIIGQAPGRRVHESGVPWNDPSGDRLRAWLSIGREAFYDESRIAILPMGLCDPGTVRGADLPPRPECAPAWHDRLLRHLPHIAVTVLVGGYAQARYLPSRRKTLTETVAAWAETAPRCWPLPHPSWRNSAWLKANPWFEAELLPPLRSTIADALAE